jgi:hypothetical protein
MHSTNYFYIFKAQVKHLTQSETNLKSKTKEVENMKKIVEVLFSDF